MKQFKARGLLAVIILSAALAGCGAQDKPNNNSGSIISPTATPTAEPTAAINERDAIIYLTDSELNETIEKQVTLVYETEADLIKSAMQQLQQEPANDELALWKPIEIKSVELAAGVVTLDIHLPDEARLGAPGEMLVLETLKKTLFQFDFVQAIELLNDGLQVDTLMGHVELEHPMNRD